MSTATALAKIPHVGVGSMTAAKNRRKAPLNDEGMTYRGWLDRAKVASNHETFEAWQSCIDPKDFKGKAVTKHAADNPMSGGMKASLIVGGLVVGLSVVGGVIYLVKKRNAAKAGWVRSSDGTIPAGAPARVAVSAASIQSLLPVVSNGAALTTMLTDLRMLTKVTAWGPGENPGWSFADDPNPASEFHAQFVNASGSSINPRAGILGMPSLPWTVWVYVGAGG